jgi:regulator of sirC expression with transglutaminase-like and TPR domain
MEFLRAALQGHTDVGLDQAALEMACIESPGLDPRPSLENLDRMALDLSARLPGPAEGPEFVRGANQYLFEDLGFRGNEAEYHDPRNSCLNHVLDRRTGIPIALSVVYIEVARRMGQPVVGIGLPGHFIVEYDDGRYSTYIDPFHAGKLLTAEDCRKLAQKITRAEVEPSALAPVSTRYILVRMLNNLRAAYFRGKQFAKMAQVMDLLIEAFPGNADYYKARGVARLKLKKYRSAKSDLEMYLEHSPEAEDRAQVTQQLEAIHRWLARLN